MRTTALVIVIVVLAALVALLADTVVRLENQRHAMQTNLCRRGSDWDFDCLNKVQSREAWGWHLYYAMTVPKPPVKW